MGTWNPQNPSMGSNGASWGKKEEKDTASGPEICWVHDGSVDPLGLIDMDEEEKEVGRSDLSSSGSALTWNRFSLHPSTEPAVRYPKR